MPDIDSVPIRVHAGMQDLSSQMLGVSGELVQELADLQKQLQPMRESYQAVSADEHWAVHTDWQTTATELFGGTDANGAGGTLGSIATAVHINWTNYEGAEFANRKTWRT